MRKVFFTSFLLLSLVLFLRAEMPLNNGVTVSKIKKSSIDIPNKESNELIEKEENKQKLAQGNEKDNIIDIYGGFNIGCGFLSKSFNRNLLTAQASHQWTFNLNTEFVYNKQFGLEIFAGQQADQWNLKESITGSDSRNYIVNSRLKNSFIRFGTAFSYYTDVFLFSRSATLFGKLGIEYQGIGAESLSDQEYFNIDNEDISFEISLPKSRVHLRPEIGIMLGEMSRYLNDYGWFISLSYNYCINGAPTNGLYQAKDAFSKEVLRQSNFKAPGHALGINIGIRKTINSIVWKQKEKTKPQKPKKDKPKKDKPEKDKPIAEKPKDDKEDKNVEVTRKITLQQNPITISIWDNGKIDGDSVSLYLNGKPILENFGLKEEKHHIQVMLEPGENKIVMKALNLGSIPPNTATIIIDDGVLKREMTLKSSLQKSAAISIEYTPTIPEE